MASSLRVMRTRSRLSQEVVYLRACSHNGQHQQNHDSTLCWIPRDDNGPRKPQFRFLPCKSKPFSSLLSVRSFDETYQLDAPIEYHGVGKSLTRQRLEAAESGSSHITARKLGALFEHIIPSTPRLFEAYGTRASSIANQPSSGATQAKQGGIFSSFMGADGTSIWAAATSGRGAIAVHLLACML